MTKSTNAKPLEPPPAKDSSKATKSGPPLQKVFVLNMRGQPLMPCSQCKARKLVDAGKAAWIKHTPETIQLKIATGETKQDITLGVDPGARHIGLSAATKKDELYAAEIETRTDNHKLLSERRDLRHARRNRKTRYRAKRFDNRARPKGWLAPSIEHRLRTHLSRIAEVMRLLPVTKIVVEVASFDIQKLQNPDISGEEYQQGPSLGEYNRRAAVLARDGYQCCYCHGKSKDPYLEVHHIESRRTGGNAYNNLVTLCHTCHQALHNDKITLNRKRGSSFINTAYMNITSPKLVERLKATYPEVEIAITYGYITKFERDTRGIAKSHCADAFCIAGNFEAKRLGAYIFYKQTRRHNRKIHKLTINKGGKRKFNQAPYELFGFRLFDKVSFLGQVGFIFGRRRRGVFDIRRLDNTRIAEPSYKNLKLLRRRTTFLSELRTK